MTEQALSEAIKWKAPKAFGQWYVIYPAMPSGQTESGKVHLSDNAKDTQLWYGIVVSSPVQGVQDIDVGDAVFFNRSAAIEKVPAIDADGIPGGFPYVAVTAGSIMAHWSVRDTLMGKFLNPPATPPDHEWAKQMQKRIDLSL